MTHPILLLLFLILLLLLLLLMQICPAVGVNLTPLMKVQSCVGGILNLCCPKYRIVPAVRLEDMSPEESVIQELLADPLWQHDKAPVCTALNIQKGMKIIQVRIFFFIFFFMYIYLFNVVR